MVLKEGKGKTTPRYNGGEKNRVIIANAYGVFQQVSTNQLPSPSSL
jgi:hypothetical protein